jgi:hypothetical protein
VTSQRVVGYDGMWARPDNDPRMAGTPVGELATIREYLSNYRLTLGMKCEDLSREQLATRSVPPSTLSLNRPTPTACPAESRWSVPSVRRRLVGAKSRSK